MQSKDNIPVKREPLTIEDGELFVAGDKGESVTYNIHSVTGGVVTHTYVNVNAHRNKEELISVLRDVYVRQLKPHVLKALRYYVPVSGSLTLPVTNTQEDAELRKPLHDAYVLPFLANISQKFLFLLGESGAGKSTYVQKLVQTCWDDFDLNKSINRIPIVVECSSLLDKNLSHHSLDQELIRQYGLTEVEVHCLRELPLILIFDGYDEKQVQDINIYEKFNLKSWDAKVIVTCRTIYIHENRNYKIIFPDKRSTESLELFVCQFSKTQIDACVSKYVEDNVIELDETLGFTRENYPEIFELMENPLLLTMVVSACSNIIKKYHDQEIYNTNKHRRIMHLKKITRADIYKAFIETWCDRAARRLMKITGQLEVKLWDFPNKFITQEAFGVFCESLAFSMYRESIFSETDKFEVDYKLSTLVTARRTIKNNSSWAMFFTIDDDVIREIRHGSPLEYINDKFKFFHKSFLEYFVALSLFNAVLDEENLLISNKEFLINLVKNPINQFLITNDESIVSYISEMLKGEYKKIERLLAIVFASRNTEHGEAVSIAASNAITILNRASFNFSGMILSDIIVDYADLSWGFFDNVVLDRSRLNQTRLSYSWWRGSSCKATSLIEADFGAFPDIIFKHNIDYVFFIRNKLQAYIVSNNTLYLVDIQNRKILYKIDSCDDVSYLVANDDGSTMAYVDRRGIVNILRLNSFIAAISSSETYDVCISGNGDKFIFSKTYSSSRGSRSDVYVYNSDDIVDFSPCFSLLDQKHITCLKANYDGDIVVLGFDDGYIKIWNTLTNNVSELCYVKDSMSMPWSRTKKIELLELSKDMLKLVSVSKDNTLLVWNVRSGQAQQLFISDDSGVLSISLSEDGNYLAVLYANMTLTLWNLTTVQSKVIWPHTNQIRHISFCNSSNTLMMTSEKTIRAVRLSEFELGLSTSKNMSVLLSVVSKDNNTLYIVTDDYQFWCLSLSTHILNKIIINNSAEFYELNKLSQYSLIDKIRKNTSFAMKLKFIERLKVDNDESEFLLKCLMSDCVAFSADGKRVALSTNKKVKILSFSNELIAEYFVGEEKVTSLFLDFDGTVCLLAIHPCVKLWDIDKNKSLTLISDIPYYIYDLVGNEDRNLYAWSCDDSVFIYDKNKEKNKAKYDHKCAVAAIQLHKEKNQLLSIDESSTCIIYDFKKKNTIYTFTYGLTLFDSVSITRDFRFIVINYITSVYLWELELTENSASLQLVWCSNFYNPFLRLEQCNFDSARMSSINKILVKQRNNLISSVEQFHSANSSTPDTSISKEIF